MANKFGMVENDEIVHFFQHQKNTLNVSLNYF